MRVPAPSVSAARWLALLIPIAEAVLVLTGLLDVGAAIVAGVVLELLLAVVLVAEATAFRAAYRRARADGEPRVVAAGRGFEAVWPPVVIRLARGELGLVRSLWWAVRRRRSIGPGDVPLSYSDRFSVLMWAVCCVGGLELGIVHVVTARWPVLQWTLFAVGVYGLVWMLGFGFSLRQHPHLVRGDELVLRFGHFRSLRVPLQRLDSVRTGAVSGHRRSLEVDGDSLALAVMGDTDVELRFEPDVEVRVGGTVHAVSRLRFYVDDPRTVAELMRARV